MPVVVLRPGASGIDTMLRQDLPTRNYGAAGTLIAGRDAAGNTSKTLLKFDLSSIPANATITSATLQLVTYYEEASTDRNVSVHRSLVSWFEGVEAGGQSPQPGVDGSTWNLRNHNGSVTWVGGAGGAAGSDYVTSATATTVITSGAGTFTWNVTADVQYWINGNTNHGWWILGTNDVSSAKGFYSSDNLGDSNRPQLTIDYTEATSYTLTPTAASVVGATNGPTVSVYGSVEFMPDPVDAVGETTDPTVRIAADVYPNNVEAVGETVNPTVVWGSKSITPTPSVGYSSAVNPTVVWGDIEITPQLAFAYGKTLFWGINQDRPIVVGPADAVGATTGRHFVQHRDPEPCHNTPLLYITDGTVRENGQLNRLNLLNQKNGFLLKSWQPAVSRYKGDGQFADSPLANGRILVHRAFENPIDTFTFSVRGHDPDDLIEYTHELFSWKEQVADYFGSTWADRPVYLVARAAREQHERYALIHKIDIPNLADPYIQPFFSRGKSAIEEIPVIIERGQWLSSPPGEADSVTITNQQEWAFNTWISLANAPTGDVLTFVRAVNGTLLAGTNDTAKIFVSSDDGLNWTLLATLGVDGADAVNQIILGHSGTLVAAVTGDDTVKGIWKSTDNGLNWTRWVVPPAVSSNAPSSTTTLQPNAGSGQDTYIAESLPTRNHGVVSSILAGNNSSNQQSKGLIRFDLSAIPANAVILRARLTLYCWYAASSSSYTVGLHRGLTQWFEGNEMGGQSPQAGQNGSTWNLRNHNGSVAWAGGAGGAAGSDYTSTATDTTAVGASATSYSWDLEDDVQDWIDGTAPNYGWWMVATDSANTEKGFYSSDNTNATLRPQLLIEYTTQYGGVDGYYSVAFAPQRQEYLASGGAAGSPGLISRTIYWNNDPEYDNWYHSMHTNGEILRATVVYDEAKYGTPERFFLTSSHVPGFNLVMSPTALYHAEPTQHQDFTNVLPTMVTGGTALAANTDRTNGFVLVGTTDGKIYRANNKPTLSTAYVNLQHISTLPGEVTALYIPPPENPGMTVYAAVGSDLYVSTNGGYIWSLVTSYPATTIQALYQTPYNIITGVSEGVDGYYLNNNFTIGQEATSEEAIYVANKTHKANLTHIKLYDASLSQYEELQYAIEPPYRIFPVVPATGDIIYFGIDTADANTPSNPFSSLIFDILTPANALTIVWEYYNGSAWTALTVQDNSGSFTGLGIESIHWMPPSNQATTTVNGVEGWWVRARISAVGTDPIAPVIGNRYVYTVNLPYVHIPANEISGELPAKAQIRWQNRGNNSDSTNDLEVDRLICGLRRYDKGVNFNAFLNISDVQLPFGVSISKDADGAWTSVSKAPTGRYLVVSHSSSGRLNAWNDLVTFTLENTVARDYNGQFRAFLRLYKYGSGTNNWQFRIRTIFGSGGNRKDTKPVFASPGVASAGDFEILDFGELSIPVIQGNRLTQSISDQLQIIIQGYNTTTNIGVALYDLILIPIDEWAIDAQAPELNTSLPTEIRSNGYMDIDSITNPRASITALNRNSANQIVSRYQAVNNGPAMLQKEAEQRLWFLAMSYENYWRAVPDIVGAVQVYKQQQYLGFRGRN